MSTPFAGSTDCRSDNSPSTSALVVQAVAERSGTDPIDLPPLYESIDPDALDGIFGPTGADSPRRGRVEFAYAGYAVTVSSDGGVSVTAADSDASLPE